MRSLSEAGVIDSQKRDWIIVREMKQAIQTKPKLGHHLMSTRQPFPVRSALVMLLLLFSILLSQVIAEPAELSEEQLYNEALSNAAQGNKEKALELLDKLLEKNPIHKDALGQKGHICRFMGRTEEEFKCWDKFTQIDPNNGFVWYNRAYPLAVMKKYGDAVASYEKAKQLASDNHNVFAGSASFYLLVMGDYQTALTDFERAKALGSDEEGIDTSILWCKRVLNQLTGSEIPKSDWKPAYEEYTNRYKAETKNVFLIQQIDLNFGSSQVRFNGSKEEPFSYAPNFYVWNGSLIKDPKYGVLLENGTRFKYVHIVKNTQKEEFGIIDGWKAKIQPEAKAAAEPSNMVAKIGDYVITTEELEKRLMSELRPDDEFSEEDQQVDAREVLMKMIAEKAMVIEARKQGYLQDEQIQASIKRFEERMLINLCLGRYFKDKQDEMTVTDEEIDEKLKSDSKLDRTRATALLQREKGNRLFDQYCNQLYKKFHVRKESQNFPKAAEIHQRLLNHPKSPRKQWWILGNQITDELTQQEKDIALATYDNGKVTLKDWFNALSDIAPPGRPKDLNTPQGVERLLDRPLRMAVLVAEAESLGLDKDEDFIKQLRQREDMMLLGKATTEKTKDISDPNDQQIVNYFEKNKPAFGTPNMLQIDQIWCQDLKTARKVKAELEKDKDFEAVKQEYSLQKESRVFHTDPGSEGIFFADLWKADPNEILGPVKGFYGDGLKWRIVKILEKKPAMLKEYSDDMKGRVRSRMMDEQRNVILEKYRKELLEKYSYEIYAENIKDIDPLNIP